MLFIFSTLVLIRCLWQLKIVIFIHWCLIHVINKPCSEWMFLRKIPQIIKWNFIPSRLSIQLRAGSGPCPAHRGLLHGQPRVHPQRAAPLRRLPHPRDSHSSQQLALITGAVFNPFSSLQRHAEPARRRRALPEPVEQWVDRSSGPQRGH